MEETRKVTTELAYEPLHRFRIWKAIVDDAQRLRKGHRAYRDHIADQFDWARLNGYELKDPLNKAIKSSELTESDVDRFFRKGGDLPSAVSRQMSPSKLRVFDAFLQIKYPDIAKSFRPDQTPHVFGSVATSFYNSSEMLAANAKLNSLIFKNLHLFEGSITQHADIETYARQGEILRYPFLYFRYDGKSPYCWAHAIEIPVKLVERPVESAPMKGGDIRAAYEFIQVEGPIATYSGVCVPARIQQFGIDQGCFSLLLRGNVLRDQKTSQIHMYLSKSKDLSGDAAIEEMSEIMSFFDYSFSRDGLMYSRVSSGSQLMIERADINSMIYFNIPNNIIDIVESF